MEGIRQYLRTLRHLRPCQVVGRIVKPVARRVGLPPVPDPPDNLSGRSAVAVAVPHHDPWNARTDLLKGRFCFLNRTEVLGWPPDWHPEDPPLLWRFTLHYFHYLHLLEPEEQEALCRSWIEENPVGERVAWHPYPTSLRIVNWCQSDLRASDLQESLYRQAAYLHRHLETHIMGNHLLENARALVHAGTVFQGQGEADDWRETGLRLYLEQLGEQVLADGGHYERSPMYHALMLEGVLDVLNLLPEGHPERERMSDTARSMLDALATLTHADGRLALLNDATHEIACSPDRLFAYGEHLTGYTPSPGVALPSTGYYRFADDEMSCLIDGGRPGPDHLLAHAHADLFSYELCLDAHRVVVDPGVYEYEPGSMREYVRSTTAHNTVSVDGVDQIECWDSFRVGERAGPTTVQFESGPKRSVFEGTFDGYAERIGDSISHRRRMTIDTAASEIRVHDTVSGMGRHRVESWIHLHPDLTDVRDREAVRLERNGTFVCTIASEGTPLEKEQGWYCPEFGKKIEAPVLVLRREASLPVQLSYVVRF